MKPMQNGGPGRFHYAFLQKAISLGALVVTLAVSLPFFHLAERFDWPVLNFVGGSVFILGLFVTVFTVREVIYRMEEEGTLLFRRAVIVTLNGYVLKLCFVPFIGPVIERLAIKRKTRNPFVADDGNKE
jgi:hypothetical protein